MSALSSNVLKQSRGNFIIELEFSNFDPHLCPDLGKVDQVKQYFLKLFLIRKLNLPFLFVQDNNDSNTHATTFHFDHP